MNESKCSAAARPIATKEPQREREPEQQQRERDPEQQQHERELEQLQLVPVWKSPGEEETTWGRDGMDEVAGDGAVDGDPPWLLSIEHRQPLEIE